MEALVLPLLLFVLCATGLGVGLLVAGGILAPRRKNDVKSMPYESGVDPIHNTQRRFDVRFHLVAITFLLLDVELLFLYPWAVASRNEHGVDEAVRQGWVVSRGLVFLEVMTFLALLTLGLVYVWRKGVFRWR